MTSIAAKVKERPILFSGEMVRAVLEGRKTQTRRVAKVHDAHIAGMISPNGSNCARSPQEHISYCPYGKPGDRLWVREAFQPLFAEGVTFRDADWQTGHGYAVRYVATDGRTEWLDPDGNITDRCKPGIHMPRWASRITLEITKVRVERVQEISGVDIGAEGIEMAGNYRARWRELWDKINSDRGFGWDVNPWVWVLEFKRLTTETGEVR